MTVPMCAWFMIGAFHGSYDFSSKQAGQLMCMQCASLHRLEEVKNLYVLYVLMPSYSVIIVVHNRSVV